MTETSRLEIIIDTTKAKKGTDDVTKSLRDGKRPLNTPYEFVL